MQKTNNKMVKVISSNFVITLNVIYIKKEERSQINNLMLHLKKEKTELKLTKERK